MYIHISKATGFPQVYRKFNAIGLSRSYNATVALIDKICLTFNTEIFQWKADIEANEARNVSNAFLNYTFYHLILIMFKNIAKDSSHCNFNDKIP